MTIKQNIHMYFIYKVKLYKGYNINLVQNKLSLLWRIKNKFEVCILTKRKFSLQSNLSINSIT